MKVLSKVDKAWLAGFVDGEGYIGIVRQRKKANRQQSDSLVYHPWVIVTNTDTKILEYIQSVVLTQKRASLGFTEGHKIGYQVKITKFGEVIALLEEILPYLKVKSEQAKLLIKYCKTRGGTRIITGRGSRGKTSFGTLEEKIYQKLRVLNKRGI